MSSVNASSCTQWQWLVVSVCHPALKTIPHIANSKCRAVQVPAPKAAYPDLEGSWHDLLKAQASLALAFALNVATMKFFATFFLPFIFTTLRIYSAAAADQIILPAVPMDPNRPTSSVRPTLFDFLTIEPGTSIFFSYARELELSRLFVNTESNLTLLVPTNKAVMALTRKP